MVLGGEGRRQKMLIKIRSRFPNFHHSTKGKTKAIFPIAECLHEAQSLIPFEMKRSQNIETLDSKLNLEKFLSSASQFLPCKVLVHVLALLCSNGIRAKCNQISIMSLKSNPYPVDSTRVAKSNPTKGMICRIALQSLAIYAL